MSKIRLEDDSVVSGDRVSDSCSLSIEVGESLRLISRSDEVLGLVGMTLRVLHLVDDDGDDAEDEAEGGQD